MYRNANTLRYFFLALKQRLPGPFFVYLLTIDFAKRDENAYLKRFYTLKNALDYIYARDRSAIVLAREEKYSDGRGVHAHAIIITSSYINFKQFHKYAQQHAKTYANFNIKYVKPQTENILRVTAYIIKNKEKVYLVWRSLNKK